MKKLKRSRSQRMIAGVMGGVAEYFEIDVTIARLLYVFISIFSGGFPGVLVYIIALFVIPEE